MRYRWEAALVAVCAIWGWTFTLVRDTVARIPPFLYLSLRFAAAASVFAVLGAYRRPSRDEVRAGSIMGVALFAGYAFQTVGQQYTSPSNAGLLTGMFVVFTPLIGAVVLRRLPSRASLGGVALATAGLVLLTMPSGFSVRRGDSFEVVTAIVFAIHILLIGRNAAGRSALRLAGIQVAVAAGLSTITTIAAERTAPPGSDGLVWFTIAVTAVLATVVGFLVQVRAQQEIPPVRTAVILTAEPAFAALFGFLLAGDRLGARGYAGAGLILAGILVAETLAPERERI